MTGWPIGTIIRGRRVMWEGDLVEPSAGEVVRFSEALPSPTQAASVFPSTDASRPD